MENLSCDYCFGDNLSYTGYEEETGMYHCYIHFCLTGMQCRVFEVIKSMPALEHFEHKFTEDECKETALVAKADVILLNLQNMDVKQTVNDKDIVYFPGL